MPPSFRQQAVIPPSAQRMPAPPSVARGVPSVVQPAVYPTEPPVASAALAEQCPVQLGAAGSCAADALPPAVPVGAPIDLPPEPEHLSDQRLPIPPVDPGLSPLYPMPPDTCEMFEAAPRIPLERTSLSEPAHQERSEGKRTAYRADPHEEEEREDRLLLMQKNMRATEDFLQSLNNRFSALEQHFNRLEEMMGPRRLEKGADEAERIEAIEHHE